MELSEIIFKEGRPVDGYGPGFFRISGDVVQGAVLVLPDLVGRWGGFDDHKKLLAAAQQIDVVFVGTGPEIAPAPAEFRRILEDAGVGVEVMNSPSACRTFNILLSEGRRVGLAALPV